MTFRSPTTTMASPSGSIWRVAAAIASAMVIRSTVGTRVS
jgi:hypothetical protein